MIVPKRLLVLGFGGHARSVADVALSLGIKQLFFLDENARPEEQFCSFPVKAAIDFVPDEEWQALPASGDNARRREQIAWAEQNGFKVATLISDRATLGIGARIGAGSFVAHHAHVGPMANVGKACIINTGAVVEHECTVGDYTHISVNSVVAGRSRIGNQCFIGASAAVIDGISVGDEVVLGAGGCAVHSLTEPGVYIGVPARRMGS
ncbi:acetyltransferase [Pseudomonas sp. NPDC090203]|uniref:acetyltransferase n=1 Tax=Pseudomonas sp. NPDC090203 TaxID=3364477 RepID=UPI00382980F6